MGESAHQLLCPSQVLVLSMIVCTLEVTLILSYTIVRHSSRRDCDQRRPAAMSLVLFFDF